jgi:uncharacterized protein (DUF362 family)
MNIYLEKRDCYTYPGADYYYSPSIVYPEYPFSQDTLSPEPNKVYDMVRISLYGLGLDAARFESKEWNPLGDYVKPGAKILLKPNWVNNINPVGGLDCTITHPSIIRCVVDYCVIAGAEIIEIGDAPIQDCNIDDLLEKHGYNRVFDFIRGNGVNLVITDFRRTISRIVSRVTDKIFLQEKNSSFDENRTVEFDLKEYSHFSNISIENRYSCINYTDDKVNQLHGKGRHKYLIHQSVFDADLIINLPKPKTHRFAGITGAQKNFIGICSDKEYLPHFRHGTPSSGGDENKHITILGKLYSIIDRKRCKYIENKNIFMQYIFCFILYTILKLRNIFFKKEFMNGLWHGNDTIWRTILDINLLLLYGTMEGEVHFNRPPRNVLTIGDLIIAGEKSGPLKPSPKPLGIILASDNCALFDYIFCKITQFDLEFIPTVKNSCYNHLLLDKFPEATYLRSNREEWNNILLKDIVFPIHWKFIPNPSWTEILS